MTILAQQQVATFPIPDGELELWQPEGATYRESRDNDGPGPTGPLVYYNIPPETCPWTEDMVQELWTEILQVRPGWSSDVQDVMDEDLGWEDLDELIEGQLVDIHEPSYFNIWDQSTGLSTLIRDYKGEARKFTPEMLVQRENLNDMWNAHCQQEDEQRSGGQIWTESSDRAGPLCSSIVPNMNCSLEFVSIGESFGIAKSEYGSVYVPKSTINHIKNSLQGWLGFEHAPGEIGVGQRFEAWITFTAGKYPWRVTFQGVTNIY